MISMNPNSCEDQIIMSSAILLNVIIIEDISDTNSIMKSLEEVASIVFDIKLLKPNSFAVIFLSIGKIDPPIGPAPSGDSFILLYNENILSISRIKLSEYASK